MTSPHQPGVREVAAGKADGHHRRGAIALGMALLLAPPAIAAPPRAADDSARLRGPLHEAFAAPLAGAEAPGAVVDRHPAPPRAEAPVAFKPASPRAIWIPGYWGWEPAAAEFLWIPGVWRVPPPGMRWLPGYWREQDGGARWVRGFWYPVNEPRLRYLPPPPKRPVKPPATLTAEQFEVLGHWSFVQGRYRWNDGFVARHKSGWVWMPSHYVWTPRGALFLPGYWDYVWEARGFAFAPIRASSDASPGPAGGKSPHRPTVAVNTAALSEALFVDADHGHYLLGDYFDGDGQEKLRAWHEPDAELGADLNFVYESYRRRGTPNFPHALAERYRRRREEASRRPPQIDARRGADVPGMGVFVTEMAHSPGASRQLVEISPAAVGRVVQNAAAVTSLAAQRAKFEDGPPASSGETVAFYLPAPMEPLERIGPLPRLPSATSGQYVPGVAGREVSGARGGSLPGVRGRTVPGVDVRVPGATAPGVVPGADTGLRRP